MIKQSSLSQKGYALKILMAACMEECNLSHTPMENCLKLSKSSSAPLVDATEYRRIVGSLRYLVNTRLDLAYPMGYVSRFMEKPTTEHLLAVKRVLRYIAGTMDIGCRYERRDGAAVLVGFSNNDLAGDLDTCKSATSDLFFLGGNLITWQSQKQRVATLFRCEAEYIVATMKACQGIWLGRLLAEFRGEDEVSPFTLKIDNQSAIQLSRNPVFHSLSKHIDTKYHFIRQCIKEGRVRVEHVDTNQQLADIFMKSLGHDCYVELHTKLGLIKVKEECQA
jgi:hypothetical protein